MTPLPVRNGLGPARLRLQGGNVADELGRRFGPPARDKVLAGDVFDADGTALSADTEMTAGAHVYLYRDLPDEVPVPYPMPVLYRDDNIVAVDKPHFLATMPRGSHVAQTALVRLRRDLGLAELSPAHRLDRLTAGVLLFTARREVRGAYQSMFARGEVMKTYLAVSSVQPGLAAPQVISNRIVKQRGTLQARIEPGEPNAETRIELLEVRGAFARYGLTPITGRKHQLRAHCAALGMPICHDQIYPVHHAENTDDYTKPLQLLAKSITFPDPISGEPRSFTSPRTL